MIKRHYFTVLMLLIIVSLTIVYGKSTTTSTNDFGQVQRSSSGINPALSNLKLNLPTSTNTSQYWVKEGDRTTSEYNSDSDLSIAVKDYDKAIEIDPHNGIAWNNRGNALVILNRTEEAVRSYDMAIKINPLDAIALSDKGAALIKLGKYEDAENCLNQALALKPNDQFMIEKLAAVRSLWVKNESDTQEWVDKGNYLYTQTKTYTINGKYSDSLDAYNKAIELDPKFALAWYEKGVTLNTLGKYNESIKAYDKALESDPNMTSAQDGKREAESVLRNAKIREEMVSNMDSDTSDLISIMKQMCDLEKKAIWAYNNDVNQANMRRYECRNDSDCLKKLNEYKDLDDEYKAIVTEYNGLADKYNSKFDALWAGRSWLNKNELPSRLEYFYIDMNSFNAPEDEEPCARLSMIPGCPSCLQEAGSLL